MFGSDTDPNNLNSEFGNEWYSLRKSHNQTKSVMLTVQWEGVWILVGSAKIGWDSVGTISIL